MEPEEYALISVVESGHWWYKGLRNHVLMKLDGLVETNARILDAGCGTGGIIAAINDQFPEAETVGIDISPIAIGHAKVKAAGHIAQGSVNSLPFFDEIFDLILSLDVIYHAAVDDRKSVQEFMRVAKPGGLVVIHVPAYEWLRSDHDIVVHTARRYTVSRLRKLFGEAGFGSVECGYRNSLLFPVMVAQRLLSKAIKSSSPRSAVVRHSKVTNTFLSILVSTESKLARHGVRFSAGGSVFAIFRKAYS
jgi:SAM-dependent methyltransferase